MIPSVYALIVLAVGLILIHFGTAGLSDALSSLKITTPPPDTFAIIRPGKPQ